MLRDTMSRREFLAVSAAVGVTILLPGRLFAAVDGKKTFTILHTNDMHSSLIGMGPAADYTPFALNDYATRGGYARLAALIAKRKEARKGQGPVLVLDAGDYSMGTAFAAATGGKNKAAKEIKEWQAIMDYLRTLPVKTKGELPVIPVDERAAEVRAIKEG
jgi:2',3'-cyclic-nucleotide 2'-phosphodiesterase (5'-nucleotidase family)